MPLTYHLTVDAPSTFGADGKEVVPSKLNDNMDLLESNDQDAEDRFEDTWYDAKGSGVLAGMEPSIPVYGGLSLDIAEGVALIGYSIEVAAQSVAVLASSNPGYVFFCQDGTWHVDDDNTAPANKSSFLLCTYTSDGYDTLTVTVAARGIEYAKVESAVRGVVTTGVIKTIPVDRDFWIEDVMIVLGDSGLYTNNIVDVHVGDSGGAIATIFTDQNLRPSVASGSDPYTVATSGTPDTNRTLTAGQVLVIEVDQVGTSATDLGVVVRGRYCDKVL
jgi:hypothetical protein